jgi:hypothetical protein
MLISGAIVFVVAAASATTHSHLRSWTTAAHCTRRRTRARRCRAVVGFVLVDRATAMARQADIPD